MKYKDVKATYEREIASKSENKAKFYTIGAAVAVMLYLMLGIRPLALTTVENRKLLLELRSIERKLREKNIKISVESKKLEGLSDQVIILNQKIPSELLLEKYLEDLVLLTARSGFIVQRLRQQEVVGERITIEIDLTGNLISLSNVIDAMETSQRFTIIKAIRTATSDDLTNVRLVVQIFSL